MEQKSSLLKSSFTYGVYLALVSILLNVVLWAGGVLESMGIFGSAIIGLGSFIITFFLLFFFSKAYRNKEMGGFISFVHAFQFGLLVIVFSTLITSVYTYIFHSFIAPEYMENLMAIMQQKTMTYMENVGAPEAQIDRALEKFQEIPTVWKTLKQGLITGIVAGVILSLITAAIVKKKNEDAIIEE